MKDWNYQMNNHRRRCRSLLSSSPSWLSLVVVVVLVIVSDYHDDGCPSIIFNFIGQSIFVTAFTTNTITTSAPTIPSSSSNVYRKNPFKGEGIKLLSKNNNDQDSSPDNGEEIEEYSDFDGFIGDASASDTSSFSSFNVGSGTGSDDDFKLPDFDIDDNVDDDDTIVIGKDDLVDTSSNDSSMEQQIASIMYQSSKVDDTSRSQDLSGIKVRQFSLGQDFVLSNYVGSAGFEEVTDWEYYYQDEEDDDDGSGKSSGGKTSSTSRRQVVQPNIFDKSQPKRTRTSSGSVVRIFRGEFVGTLGGTLSAQGLDRRILVKEFTGKFALKLAEDELASIGRLQSNLLSGIKDAREGWWIKTASSRSVMNKQDNEHLVVLSQKLRDAPFLGVLGEVNLAELEGEMDPNEFYRALGVPPPKPEAVWLVYEYAGLNTVSSCAIPGEIRRSRIPPKRGFFGAVEPPTLPPWNKRADYVIKGIMKGAVNAIATLHECGTCHRSIGRSSIILSSTAQDKAEASNLYNTRIAGLVIKVADFGFSGLAEESTFDEEFCARARSFGLIFRRGETSLAASNFAMAEDLHALGFVFLGLLLSSLAELPSADHPMPATDEDTLQRLLGDIFDKDITQFREYVEAEEVWSNLVDRLDENDGAGWNLLETLFTAREKAASTKDSLQIITARSLLSNPLFQD